MTREDGYMARSFIPVVGIRGAVGQPDKGRAGENCDTDLDGMRTARAIKFMSQHPHSNAYRK